LKSVYEEFEEIVRKTGKKVNIRIFGPLGEKSTWIIRNWLILLDEVATKDNARVVVIMDKGKGGKFIYLSPYAIIGGAKRFFLIDDPDISSEERLKEILKQIKQSQ